MDFNALVMGERYGRLLKSVGGCVATAAGGAVTGGTQGACQMRQAAIGVDSRVILGRVVSAAAFEHIGLDDVGT